MRRSVFVFICLLPTVLLPTVPGAQQPKKIPRIGYLSGAGDPSNPGPNVEAFRRGLQELGYIEGKNILVEYRYIEGSGIASQVWWPNSYNSKSMFLSPQIYHLSARPSRRPRRFP